MTSHIRHSNNIVVRPIIHWGARISVYLHLHLHDCSFIHRLRLNPNDKVVEFDQLFTVHTQVCSERQYQCKFCLCSDIDRFQCYWTSCSDWLNLIISSSSNEWGNCFLNRNSKYLSIVKSLCWLPDLVHRTLHRSIIVITTFAVSDKREIIFNSALLESS